MKCTLDQVHWVLGWTFLLKLEKYISNWITCLGTCWRFLVSAKTKRRKIEFKCTFSSVSDMKDCIQVLQNFLSTFLRIFPWEKMCNQEREMDTTQNTRLRFLNNFISVALTGQSFFSLDTPSFYQNIYVFVSSSVAVFFISIIFTFYF